MGYLGWAVAAPKLPKRSSEGIAAIKTLRELATWSVLVSLEGKEGWTTECAKDLVIIRTPTAVYPVRGSVEPCDAVVPTAVSLGIGGSRLRTSRRHGSRFVACAVSCNMPRRGG